MLHLLYFLAFGTLLLLLQAIYTRYRGGLNAIPGPPSASFCNLWKISAVYRNDMPRKNIEVHRQYGPVVRIGPNHVSFSSSEALHIIHGSRHAYAKSDFYKPTSAMFEGAPLLNLFSVQDVAYHSSLKKTIGCLYTKTAVLGLEPKITDCVQSFTHRIKALTSNGPTALDVSSWVHFFTFDCLGELNASKQFGFLESGRDIKGMIEASDRILFKTGLFAQAPFLQAMRQLVEGIRAYGGVESVNPVMQYASIIVRERREKPTDSPDMLNNFIRLQESQPDKLSIREIIGAVYINLQVEVAFEEQKRVTDYCSIAGHDVLAVTLRAILYHVARHPRVEQRLREELSAFDKPYPRPTPIPYIDLTQLPYMDAVINESLRIHGNLGLVNERVTPPEGAIIDGYHIPRGTVVGINPWVIHRNTDIFGEGADTFRPERWLEGPEQTLAEMRRNLFSFGAGPRMCIGKNIAMMQICKFISEFYRHFEARLVHPDKEWHVIGNWVTKQTQMDMYVKQLD